jgi:hypothetical protein
LCLSAKSAAKKSKEFWILVLPMVVSKIRNDFIKQHQRGRWRYHFAVNPTIGTWFPIQRKTKKTGSILPIL